MSWVKLDDRFPHHRKIAPLSDAAFRLHVTAIADCSDQLTDGFVSETTPATLTRAPRGRKLLTTIQELEAKRLWDPVDGGWQIHDYLDWNPSSAYVRSKKEAARARMQRAREEALAVKLAEDASERQANGPSTDGEVRSTPSPSPSPSPPEQAQDQPTGEKPAKEGAAKSLPISKLVASAFDYWVQVTRRSPKQTKLTKERKARVTDRLRDDYTLEDIKLAILGCSVTPHNRGENEAGKRYDDLELICRTGGHLERFRETGRQEAEKRQRREAHQARRPSAPNKPADRPSAEVIAERLGIGDLFAPDRRKP